MNNRSMKIDVENFRVIEDEKVNLKQWLHK